MDTKYNIDGLAQAIQDFVDIATEKLQRGGLSREQTIYYRAHPKEWHHHMFDVLMVSLSEAMKIYNRAIGVILRNATMITPSKINEAFELPNILGPDLKRMTECWEVNGELAYEHFGTKFHFPLPSFANE